MWKLWQLCDDSSSKRSPRDLARIKYENLWKLWEFEISVWIEYEYLRLWEFICEAQDYESGLVQLLIRILWIPMFLRQGKDVWNLKPEAFDIFIKSGKCSSRLEEHQKAQLGELEIRITLNQTSCLTLMFFLFYLDGHRKHALSLHNVHLRIWPEIDKNIKIHRGNCPCFISLTIIIIITTIKGSNLIITMIITSPLPHSTIGQPSSSLPSPQSLSPSHRHIGWEGFNGFIIMEIEILDCCAQV